MALTKANNRMIDQAAVNVKDFGAVGDYSFSTNTGTDDTAAFQAAIAAGKSIFIPTGNYRITSTLTMLSLGSDVIMYGEGVENSMLVFENTSGIDCRPSDTVFKNFAIINGAATSGSIVPVRGNITASTIGLKTYGNQILVEKVRVYGFDKGFQMQDKFYCNFIGCDAQYNLVGFYNTSGGNFNRSVGGKYSLNFAKNVWVDSGSHQFFGCSIEGCTDYDNEQVNYPDGGVLVGPETITYPISKVVAKPRATFIDCYSEDNNWFINDNTQVSNMTGGANTRFNCSHPMNVSNVFTETTGNILQPPYYGNWTAGDNTITNAGNYYNAGIRYTDITSASGSGTTKRTYTKGMTAGDGMVIPTTLGDDFHIFFGCWVNIRTNNFTAGYPQFLPEATDVGLTTFAIENVARTNPVNFDSSLVNQWQYVGFMAPARNAFSTGTSLSSFRVRIELGESTEDHSSSNRTVWIGHPQFRLLFPDAGHKSGRPTQVAWQELSTGAPSWDASKNISVGEQTFPSGATNTVSILNGTAPSSGTANHTILYSSDLSSGNTIPSVYTEGTGIVGTGTPTQNRTVAIRVNGSVYYLHASTSPT
jgi:hypothetical protein